MCMSLSTPFVQVTDNGDASGEFTISFADDDHRFTASVDGEVAVVEYEETLSWRGQIRVSKPDEHVYKELMQSDEMTQFLETYGLTGVRRER